MVEQRQSSSMRLDHSKLNKNVPGTTAESVCKFLEDERKNYFMAFLVDITSHLNDLNLKLQGKNNSVCDLVAAVQSFFKVDLQENFTHFPAMKQIQGGRNISSHVEFIQKLIGNFSDRFDEFSLEEQVLLFIQNPFLSNLWPCFHRRLFF